MSGIIHALRSIVGDGGCLSRPEELLVYECDGLTLHSASPLAVVLVRSREEVQRVVRACREYSVPFVPRGAGTGLSGGALADGAVVIEFSRMNRILEVNAADRYAVVEPGVINADLSKATASLGLFFAPDPSSQPVCTIGGNIAENSGGPHTLKYGSTTNHILGLEVVLPDGQVLDQLRGLRKDNTGYDVKQLFIGAEGTLGVITAACLKLFPRPGSYATALAAVPSPAAAVELLGRLRTVLGDSVTTFELIPRIALELVCRHIEGARDPLGAPHPWYVLAEAGLPGDASILTGRLESTLAEGIEAGIVEDAALAASLAQREAFWRLRESIPEAQTREGASLKHDISLPSHDLPAFIAEAGALLERQVPGSRLVAYGHLGDGNLHFNLSQPPAADGAAFLRRGTELRRAVYDMVAHYRGSFSAEHGIGRNKLAELERYEDPVALSVMRGIKRLLDPQDVMNPGKVLREP